MVGGAVGVSSAGAINTQIHQLSVINAANGVLLVKEPQNQGVPSTTFTYDTLVASFQGIAFKDVGDMAWSFVNCAPWAPNVDPVKYYFQPNDGNVTNIVTADPALGGCLVFLPPSSPLNTAGTMGAVGANVLRRYEDGILGPTLLWTPTGEFPCGTVIDVVNRDADRPSCTGVHKRLHVAPAGTMADANHCPLP